MEEDAELPAVGLLEERPVEGCGQGPTPDVAEQDDAVQLERAERAVELLQGLVRRVHGDRGEALEPARVAGHELRVGVVHHPRDLGLRFLVGEEDIRRRERDDLHVDPHAVHVRQTLLGIGHGRLDPEEAGAPVLDDRPARRVLVEAELPRGVADLLEVRLRVVVGVEVEPEPLASRLAALRVLGEGGRRSERPHRSEKASSVHRERGGRTGRVRPPWP
jgi:hypothetical protein